MWCVAVSKTIEIYIPNRDSSSDMNASLAKTLQELEEPDTEEEYSVRVNHSYLQPVDANRNEMVKGFLDTEDAEWLLMIDNDVVPPPDVLSMVEHGRPVVSATVCIRKNLVPEPIIVKEQGSQYRQVGLGEYEDEVRDDGLLPVDGMGTGCLLLHRSVLEGMEPPWFNFKYNEYGGLRLGEDFAFSRKLNDANVPLFVDTEIICRHFKTVELSEFTRAVGQAKQEAQYEVLQEITESDKPTHEVAMDKISDIEEQT